MKLFFYFSSEQNENVAGKTKVEANDLEEKNSNRRNEAGVTLELTILALRKEDIEAVKKDVKKCCEQESADVLISRKEYSNIIKGLNKLQVIQIPLIY